MIFVTLMVTSPTDPRLSKLITLNTLIEKSGWIIIPTAFFLSLNFAASAAKILFAERLLYFLFIVFLFLLLRRVNLEKILKPIVAGISAIVFIYGLLQKFVLFPIYLNQLTPQDNFYTLAMMERIQGGRIYSIFSLPTLYAIVCTVLIFFLLHYMRTSSTGFALTGKLGWGVLLALGLINLVLTQSFAGIIYLTVGGLVYLIFSGILKLKYLLPTSMVLVFFLSIMVAFRFEEVKKLEPIKLRISNWTQATRIIGDYPFWGVGLGNYEAKIAAYTFPKEARSIYAHNFFLQFIAETGILPPLFFLLFLFLARKALKPRDYHQKVIYITVWVVLLIYNLIDIGFYFFAAAIMGAVVLSQIYPYQEKKHYSGFNRRWENRLILVTFILLATLLGLTTYSDDARKAGDFYSAQKEFDNARLSFKKALAINPWNVKALIGFAALPIPGGDITKAQQMAAQAETYLDKALYLNPDSAYACYLKSRFLFKKNQLLDAYHFAASAWQKNKLMGMYQTWLQIVQNTLQKTVPTNSTDDTTTGQSK